MTLILYPQPIFTPVNLYGGVVWYNARSTSFGAVASWTDLFGNSNNATQGTGANQPTNAANNINGQNALVFNDVHSLNIGNIPNLYLGFSCFAVMKYNQDTSVNGFGNMVAFNGAAAATNSRQPLNYFQKSATRINQSVGTFDAVINSVSSGQNVISYIQYDGATTIKTSLNSSTLASTTITQLTSSSNAGILGSNCKGSIGEIVLYNRALSTAEYLAMLNYFSNAWGIVTS